MKRTSDSEVGWHAQMPTRDFDKKRVTLCSPHSYTMADYPKHKACEPKTKSQSKCGGKGTI
jgi:hypothetical protein